MMNAGKKDLVSALKILQDGGMSEDNLAKLSTNINDLIQAIYLIVNPDYNYGRNTDEDDTARTRATTASRKPTTGTGAGLAGNT